MTLTNFEDAKALHQAGELDAAAAAYQALVEADPAHFRALHNLGAALEALGRTDEAEAAYARALAANPDAEWTHYNLARLYHLAGRLDDAERGYRRALEIDPEDAAAHFNLGRLLLERGEPVAAELPLRAALERTPEDAGAHSYLGDALFAQRRMHDALASYVRTVELDPADAAAQFDVGKSLELLRQHNEAIAAYRRAIELDPASAAAHEALARALDSAGRSDEALASVRAWLAHEPDQPIALHLLASLGGSDVPARASDGYVRDTFDRFAPDFDATLEKLDYRAPQLLAAATVLALGEPRGGLDVLDAGCGTGLCGPLLKPFARRLEGVDLSPAMIVRARRRGGYDALHEAELVEFLVAGGERWDLIASADTLIYFGPLEPPLSAAAAALRPGGVLVFTLEECAGDGFVLSPHGRFAHSQGYVRAALAACGFDATLGHGTLRREGGVPVAGFVVAAKRRER